MDCLRDSPVSALRRPGCRLLIVDDEEHITAAISDYFTMLGYVVDRAPDEAAAHTMLETFNYAAVVTDLQLGCSCRIEGLDIIEHVRARHPQAACIVLTAYGDVQNESEALRRGADALLQKPAPLRLLAEWLARLLDSGPDSRMAPDGLSESCA